MVQGVGAGLDEKVQAGTKPIVTKNDNIHTKSVITKAKDKDEMVQGVGEGLDDMVQGEGAGLDEMVQGMGAGLDEKVKAGTKSIVTKNDNIHAKNVITEAKYEDAKNGNIHAKPKEQEDVKTRQNINIHAKPKEH